MKLMLKIFLSTLLSHMLFSQGIPLGDINKIINDYEKLSKDLEKSTEYDSDINKLDDGGQKIKTIYKLSEEIDNKNSKHFGYNFFESRDSLNLFENLAAPNDYLLGPGDEIIIILWGETQLRKNYRIENSGSIYDEKVGLLYLNGKTLSQSYSYLKSQFGRVYSTLNG